MPGALHSHSFHRRVVKEKTLKKECVDLRCSCKRENINPETGAGNCKCSYGPSQGHPAPPANPAPVGPSGAEFPGLESLCCVSFQKITENQMNSLRGFGISHGPANLWDS